MFLAAGCSQEAVPEPSYPVPDLTILAASSDHSWNVDIANSHVTFEFLEKGETYSGQFNRFDMMIDLDLKDPSMGQITALIDLASVDAGTSDRNKVLRDAEMFFVREHPVARFHSAHIMRLPNGNFEARGELSLKDIRKAIVLPFSITHNEGVAVAKARFEMNRLDYRVGTGSFMSDKYVGYPVTVQIEVRARKQNVEESLQ